MERYYAKMEIVGPQTGASLHRNKAGVGFASKMKRFNKQCWCLLEGKIFFSFDSLMSYYEILCKIKNYIRN